MNAIVSDATSLIILVKLGRLELLNRFFAQVIIPSEVMKEVQGKEDHDYKLFDAAWLKVQSGIDLPLFKELCMALDPGESEALALADHLKLPALVDEKKGRTIAARRGIPVIGLVGILMRATQRHMLSPSEARTILTKAQAIGFRLSDSLAAEFEAAIVKVAESQ